MDVTASEDTYDALILALNMGYCVVLANKKPLARAWKQSSLFFNNPHVRHESTVGAGMPIVASLKYLMDTGDEATRNVQINVNNSDY